MKQATLTLFYLVKYLEMIFLWVWTGLLISSAIWLLNTITLELELTSTDE